MVPFVLFLKVVKGEVEVLGVEEGHDDPFGYLRAVDSGACGKGYVGVCPDGFADDLLREVLDVV